MHICPKLTIKYQNEVNDGISIVKTEQMLSLVLVNFLS